MSSVLRQKIGVEKILVVSGVSPNPATLFCCLRLDLFKIPHVAQVHGYTGTRATTVMCPQADAKAPHYQSFQHLIDSVGGLLWPRSLIFMHHFAVIQ